ncbi:MAG: respiratory-chain NADH dehydrogenase subunit 1 [Acidimicrobiaceae bacterium]|nr:MAG: respiratory-chain NADH dehydrogenase subunit 1 [Acidimicrobiaceae bacterium]
MSPTGIAVAVLQVILTIAAAPLLAGVMRFVRARLSKLLGKERMVSSSTGWVFSSTPLVLIASVALVAGIVPFLSTTSALDQVGDLFAVVYLLLLGTVFLSLAGLDGGTAFGGMGASRAMTITAIAEPTVLVAIFALSVSTGSSNLGAIVASTLARPSAAASPESLLAFAALAVVTIAETGRIPVDNPNTHLELTMIHEAMIHRHHGAATAPRRSCAGDRRQGRGARRRHRSRRGVHGQGQAVPGARAARGLLRPGLPGRHRLVLPRMSYR